MSDATRIRIGQTVGAVAMLAAVGGTVCMVLLGKSHVLFDYWTIHNGMAAAGFGAIAFLVVRKQPRNAVVWAAAWSALAGGSYCLSLAVTHWILRSNGFNLATALDLRISEMPLGAALAAGFASWLFVPALQFPLTVGFSLFPDGKLPGRRWRWTSWASIGGIALVCAVSAYIFRPTSDIVFRFVVDQGAEELGEALSPGWFTLALASQFFVVTMVVISLIAMVFKYRRSEAQARKQFKWVMWGASVMLVLVAIMVAVEMVTRTTAWSREIFLVGLVVLIGSYGIAIGKYRLYDVDVVISKTLVYGSLAGLIAGMYVVIVVGLGTLLGLHDAEGGPNTLLGLAALVVIPIVFQPARRRLERWANRVVYGRRATPYEVLSSFSQRVAAVDPDVLVQVSRSLEEGTTAEAAAIWAVSDGERRQVAAWPPEIERFPENRVTTAPIIHNGEELGQVALLGSPGQQLLPTDERLLVQVASGLGLALRNQALTADLRARVEQLRESRRRIVAVQDRTRRQLERNLHDGAQQRLVALKIKLGLATAMAEKEGLDGVGEMLVGLRDQTDVVIDTVREFARGIYPPLLEAEGLPAALTANFRNSAVPVSLQATEVGRYPRDVEATIYFCLLQAVTAAANRGAASVHVYLAQQDDNITFHIRDDGQPADEETLMHIIDRIDAAGGRFDMTSHPTTVNGEVPVPIGVGS